MRLRARALAGASDQLTDFLRCIDLSINGNVAVGTKSSRYFAPDGLPAVERTVAPPPVCRRNRCPT